MSKVKFSALITNITGKLGGQVLQGGNTSAIIRTGVNQSNKKSFIATPTSIIFSNLAKEWNKLSNDIKLQWSSATYLFLIFNSFGDQIQLSGYNLFVRLNYDLFYLGEDLLTVPPDPSDTPQLYTCVGGISVETHIYEVNFFPHTTPADESIIFTFSNPCKNPYGIFKNLIKKGKAFIEKLTSTTKNYYNDYDEQMHGPMYPRQVGQFVIIEWYSVKLSSGIRSVTQSINVVVSA